LVLGSRRSVLIAAVLAACVALVLVPAAFAQSKGSVPGGLKVGLPTSSGGGVLKLTWDVTSPESISSYKVYRSASPDGGFKAVFSDTADTRLNVMQFMDTGLVDGATYYYKVTVTDRSGRESAASNVAKGTLPALAGPSAGDIPGGKDNGREKGKHIIISVVDNRIWFLENGVLVKTHLCSTGTSSHPTPLGVFKVLDHEYCAISVKYGGVYMYWWMGFAPDTGMHALPYDPKSGTWTSADCLGTNASHGCVRQAMADAQWAYNWAPNGTRIDVIAFHWTYVPPPPPPPPTTGGHGSQGISKLSHDWYFAEGCTSGNFDEYLCMMNPSDKTATVNATYMKPDGSVVGGAYTVQPFARFTVHVDDIPGLESAEVSTHLSSDVDIAAERSEYFYDYSGKNGGTDSAGVTAPGRTWYLAEGYTGGDFDEYVLIQNPNSAASTVHVQYMKPDGQTVLRTYGVNATSRMSLHVDDIPELAGTDVSTKVSSTLPVVVERAQYFNYYGKDDGNASAAVSAPSKLWYLAEGYTGGEFDEYVLMQNPGATAGKATVTFMCEDGTNVVRKYDLLANSRFTIHVDEIPELASRSVSTKVEADVDIIAERAEYFVSYGRTGGADAPGVSEPQKYWYLAEGYTGGEFDTYVLVMNPGDKASDVDVNYLLPGGGIKQARFTVPAHSRYTVHLDEVQGLTNTEVATALTGSEPVICERAMYFSISNE
jgi:lipoprotein-anchoring transpeptidase ErfK/SrfK